MAANPIGNNAAFHAAQRAFASGQLAPLIAELDAARQARARRRSTRVRVLRRPTVQLWAWRAGELLVWAAGPLLRRVATVIDANTPPPTYPRPVWVAELIDRLSPNSHSN